MCIGDFGGQIQDIELKNFDVVYPETGSDVHALVQDDGGFVGRATRGASKCEFRLSWGWVSTALLKSELFLCQ